MQVFREPAYTEDARRWLASALVATPFAGPEHWPGGGDGLWGVIETNGLTALIHQALSGTDAWERCTPALRTRLERYARQEAAAELLRAAELERVLRAFANAGLDVLLMKGTALAYSLYPEPHLRPRCDSDLLLRDRDQASRARECLRALDYQWANTNEGTLVSHQFIAHRTDPLGITHCLDVHWRVNNAERFARALDFPELETAAIPLPGLGDAARGLGAVHALLLACMHRVGHLPDGSADRLLWLYDIHLLAEGLDQAGWRRLADLSAAKGQCTVVLDGLLKCVALLGTGVPAPALRALEAAARYEDFRIERVASRWRRDLENFRALPRWGARLRLLREHLFPNPAYMLAKYGESNNALLPVLYARRIARAAVLLLARARQG